MRVPFVDLNAQYATIRDDIATGIQAILDRAAFIGGPALSAFEDAFARFCHAEWCVGVGNGTDALVVALRSLGIGPGDEVITAANSFIATSEAITLTGARVVFADCHSETYCIDPARVAAAITPRTKAIVPVHLYGRPADMPALLDIAGRHNLTVVEDCAQAHGATIDGQPVGTFGHAGCFSFYPGKNLGAYGDGGAIITNDAQLAKSMRMLANHGRISKYDHEFEGMNSRLDGLQAAVLSIKLPHLPAWTEQRRKAAARYNIRLAAMGLPTAPDGVQSSHVYHLMVTRVANREAVQAKLAAAGIATGVHYPVALPNLTAYRYLGHAPSDFPLASRYQDEVLSLPMYPEITAEQIDYVCDHLAEAVA